MVRLFLLSLLCTISIGVSAESYNGHEYVDLGLSVKWATCNIGASKPEEYGDKFAWGETNVKSSYTSRTYFSGDDEEKNYKYDKSSGKTTLDIEDDAAHVKWGGDWRMPTRAEADELLISCDSKWTTQGGVEGCLFTSRINGKSIFLPAAGFLAGDELNYGGMSGHYWTSWLYSPGSRWGYVLFFNSHQFETLQFERCGGCPIRPVCP